MLQSPVEIQNFIRDEIFYLKPIASVYQSLQKILKPILQQNNTIHGFFSQVIKRQEGKGLSLEILIVDRYTCYDIVVTKNTIVYGVILLKNIRDIHFEVKQALDAQGFVTNDAVVHMQFHYGERKYIS